MTIARFESIHSTLTITRPVPHVLVLVITGRDVGEHGKAPFAALEEQLRAGPYALFVDARDTKGASVDVSNVWAQWLRTHRDELHGIHMLTGTKFVQLTADFVRRFAELGDAMRIYTDGMAFDEALRSATKS
ncbi:MAG TPA: hypothetical protein VL326_05590 [Kofleriaceae bacterium]|jgi:hypothetical protein|nr:hypothetical protein [Kofleriaceae bacterium]